MTSANEIITLAAEFGVTARLWQKGNKTRIYADAKRRDMSVYLECDGTADDIEGAALNVFCSTQQNPAWIKSQVAACRERFIGLFYAWVVTHYADVGPAPNGYGPDINGMIDEARAAVVAARAENED
jgi:hypothetical protein